MTEDIREVQADGIALRFDAALGLIESFTVTDGGRVIAPLHRAPWVGTSDVLPEGAAPHMRKLGGDFFCAPFAGVDDGSPLHGWPPNSGWDVALAEDGHIVAALARPVMGARLTKHLVLRDGHPFVYQRHVFVGGQGEVSAANHANIDVSGGAIITASPKRHWETPRDAQESDPTRGRSALRYPAQTDDPRAFPGTDGPADLTRYPWNPAHEDFVVGIEAPGHALGWTAVVRPDRGDLYLSLRDPRVVPMTMLWHSNGGRDYAPWNGRHRGCLGVEEGAAAHMLGVSGPDVLTGPGTLTLGGQAEMRHAIGALAWPTAEPVADVSCTAVGLRITGTIGTIRSVLFDASLVGLED